jgi:Protein of unknown function (DUF2800)
MDFNKHSNLNGMHAFLSASSSSWLNYNEDKLDRVYLASLAAQRGTRTHAFAHEAIDLGIRLPDNGKTVSLYVNDAIGYKMTCEQVLFGTPHCFGTADTISYRHDTLRIHDLKTGSSETSMQQLMVYAALFCMEYEFNAMHLPIELRIYQNNKAKIYVPEGDEIVHIIDKIIIFSKRIEQIRAEVRL